MIKVVFVARPDLFRVKGGDTIQIKSTAKYLSVLGVEADIRLADEDIDYSKYDLVHFFNVIDCEDLLGHAIRCGKPYLISTIYVDYGEYDRYHRGGTIGLLSKLFSRDQVEFLKTIAKWFKGEPVSTPRYFFMGHKNAVKYLLKNAACLLPNSESEYRRLLKDYGIKQVYRVVPNAIDTEVFKYNEPETARSGILCVARIEGRKNQLNLIRAVKKLGEKLVLVGSPSPNQQAYVKACHDEGGENTLFVDHISQEELLDYYRSARVHVLPSWFETTGLSSLEAGVMGCQVVVADKGDVRDYFGDLAYYCNAFDPDSIADSIRKAYHEPVNPELRNSILQKYTWQKAAEETVKAYRKVMNHDKF